MFAPQEKEFILAGKKIISLRELAKELDEVNAEEFKKHQENEDFSKWARDVFGLDKLAKNIKGKSPADMKKAINKFLKTFVYDLIIIGAGIAGMTSAVYAARKRSKFRIISEDVGGQIAVSGNIENWPGEKQTNFLDFQKKFDEQLKFNNIKVDHGKIKSIKKSNGYYKIETDKKKLTTRTIIIATGARPRRLKVKGEAEFDKKGVTYCAWCDGPLFKDKPVAVIGGGASALEAAEFMSNISPKIYLINIMDKLGGHEILKEKVNAHKNIIVLNNTETTEIFGDAMVTGLKYKQDGKETSIDVAGILVEIGMIPNTELAKGLVDIDEDDHIKVDKQTKTSKPGIFAAGDCSDIHGYQFATAAGAGCMALLQASKYLQETKK